jgi:hypothetical protein
MPSKGTFKDKVLFPSQACPNQESKPCPAIGRALIHIKGLIDMNRTERNELARQVRRLVRDVKLSAEAFRDAAERLLEKENGKLADMPESLSTSRNASRCEDAVEMLDDALENAMSLIDTACEIAQGCNIDVTKGRISEHIPCMASYEPCVNETKSARLQLLVRPSLLEFLRIESQSQGCSVNRLVNDTLVQAFKAR